MDVTRVRVITRSCLQGGYMLMSCVHLPAPAIAPKQQSSELEAIKQELEAIKQRLPEPIEIPRPVELVLEIGLPCLAIVLAFFLGWYFASPVCP